MTITLLSIALCVAIVALTASPMFRAGANRSLGTGKEDDSPVRRWQEEKDRLTAQLRDNDLALAEGRIDDDRVSGVPVGGIDQPSEVVRHGDGQRPLGPVLADHGAVQPGDDLFGRREGARFDGHVGQHRADGDRRLPRREASAAPDGVRPCVSRSSPRRSSPIVTCPSIGTTTALARPMITVTVWGRPL